ncbi:exoribonuclease II [Candidatus Ishikawella capsulata]|uniref:Exoribonuclease 2 n=1 Tax=Candidatus Ishikawaella capsulata Mpkobe TaxID=476281 RepID=C5WC94_9ENTR|nr:exoribonuclease II [Candidatus Ishikawaella capsulata]BAH82950.1 exoribonuclease II [Candidatus Ishikawaella capsulata Mpkobe]
MLQGNPLLKQLKKQLNAKMPRVEGVVKCTKNFGFLEANSKKNYFIPPTNMKKVIHGDRIIAVIHTSEEKREIAEPEILIESFLKRFIGKVIQKKENNFFIIPDHPIVKQHIIPCQVATNLQHNFKIGDWAIAEIRKHPLKDNCGLYAELTEFIVREDDSLVPWWVTLSRYNLERHAPKAENVELYNDHLIRKDLTDINFITVDNSNTEDMDDAVYVEEISDGKLRLNVAIADPTAYISEGSKLDKIAAQRAFTNYLPGFNIPMLPREISDNICSLHPHVPRPVLVCSVIVNRDGTISHEIIFFTAWITSKAKLAYNNVSDWLEKSGNWVPPNDQIASQLHLLHDLCLIRKKWRQDHALVFHDRPDYRFIINKKNEVTDIIAEPRRIANRMIEEAMIVANICAAKVLYENLGFGVYNVHTGFDAVKAEQVSSLLAAHGIIVDTNNIRTLEGFCLLKRKLNEQPTRYLESLIRRFQSSTEITTKPGPHFVLGLECYATWTSPIRKYGDMINHRLLKIIIKGEKTICPAETLTTKISEMRRLNRLAERDITDWLYADFLSRFAGTQKKFTAEIIDVARSGMRIRLLENGASAFIPKLFIHDIPNELTYSYENGTVLIKNEIIYRISDMIKVSIDEVRREDRSIIARPVCAFI